MISWLIRLIVPNWKQTSDSAVRYKICRLLGYVGIGLNFFLFASKYCIGLMAGSVAIKGDAVNNLTDSMNNIVSILSFHFAEKPADKEHPYGHERTETIAALFMGMLIVYLGFEMLKQSIEKLLTPAPVTFSWAAVSVLVISIMVKLYMYSYNRKYGKIYKSELLEANAIDSKNDMLGTFLILVSSFLSPVIHYDLDGIMGIVISGIIFYSAYGLLKEVINQLLGEAPSIDLINQVTDMIMESPLVIDVHDVTIHIYGPKYRYATAHVEVDGTLNMIDVHHEVDRLERMIMKDMNIELVIHVDPVLVRDEATCDLEDLIGSIIARLNEKWTLQDFRADFLANDQTVIYFDLIVPYDEPLTQKEIQKQISDCLPKAQNYHLVMRLAHPYS